MNSFKCPLLLAAAFVAVAASAAAPLTAAAFTPDGKHVVLGSQDGIEIRTWPELTAVKTFATELRNVHDLSFSPDGKTLLAAGGSPAESGAVETLSWPGAKRIRSVTGNEDVVYRAAWSPDGTRWATAGADGLCQVFSAASGERLARFEGHSRPVLSLCWLPDGNTIVSAGVDQTLQVWESATGKHLRTLDNHVGAVNALALQPSENNAAPAVVASISEDRTVRLWQPAIGRLIRFTKLPSTPRTLAWSASGDQLLVGCNDGHVRILNTQSLEVEQDHASVAGRIHELLIDPIKHRVLVAGEAGCQAISPVVK